MYPRDIQTRCGPGAATGPNAAAILVGVPLIRLPPERFALRPATMRDANVLTKCKDRLMA